MIAQSVAEMDPGERAIGFISKLTLSDEDKGKPFNMMEWQKVIPRKLFGTLRPDGLRQYRKCFLFLPRKNAKTQLASAIGVYCLLGSGRQGESIILAAASVAQACHLFDKAVEMIQASKFWSKRVKIYDAKKMIKSLTGSGNILRVVSSDGKNQHGHNPSLVIIDELHAQKNKRLYEALTTGFGTRSEPLTILISTACDDKESLAYEVYEHARKVRDDPSIDDKFLPIIYEAGLEDDWGDEATWFKANPALGVFNKLDNLRTEFAAAKLNPSLENSFRKLYLNQWVADTAKWLNQDAWDICGQTAFDRESLKGRECWGGLDLSNTSDITALVLTFPFPDGSLKVLPFFWIPREYARKQEAKGYGKYSEWARQGLITLTDGDVIDHNFIVEKILELCKLYKINKIKVDPNGANQGVNMLMSRKPMLLETMRQLPQYMSPAINDLTVLIAKGLIHHGNNAILNWQAANAVTKGDSYGNVRLDKQHSASKIDGVISLVMGVAGALNEKPKTPSYVLVG